MRIVLAALAALAVMLTAVLVVATGGGEDEPGGGFVLAAVTLQPFDDCEQLLGYYQEHALDVVGPYGLEGEVPVLETFAAEEAAGGDTPVAGAAGDATAERAVAPQAGELDAVGPGATGTNVQEAGVDEPDIVKTNGRVVVAVAQGRLQVVDVSPGSPALAGSLPLPSGWQQELLIDGDRALVVSRGDGGAVPLSGIEDGRAFLPVVAETTVLTAVDLSDPANPRVEATLTLDGSYRSARAVDGTARIVLASRPVALPFTAPQTGGLRAEQQATEANRDVVRDSVIEDWLPWSVLTDADGDVVQERPLLACGDVRRPQEFAGLSTLTVLTVDLGQRLATEGTTGVVASGDTVYASPDRLYVATTAWSRTPVTETEIHAFDLTDLRRAPYLASGAIEGRLLNSYALSAHEGYLRVAATTDAAGPGAESESAVVVLAEEGGVLREVGRVGGLGRTEEIRAVRFLDDLATVVTFRQTDPLYTIDLSDPRQPELLGELKIPGFSAYLHPVGEDRLLGVGQDADASGRTLGVQASLFDLADLADPARVDQLFLGEGYAEVENDPRAFLFWPAADLAVVPLQTFGPALPADPLPVEPDGGAGTSGVERGIVPAEGFAGAVAIRVEGDRLVEAGRLEHDDSPIRRSLIVGDTLITMSEGGLGLADLATLQRTDFVAFRS